MNQLMILRPSKSINQHFVFKQKIQIQLLFKKIKQICNQKLIHKNHQIDIYQE